jgi:hypothetical protein
VQDLDDFNTFVKDTCLARGKKYINLAKTCQKETRKRRALSTKVVKRFTSQHLQDGLHPTVDLIDTWAKLIQQAIVVFFDLDIVVTTPKEGEKTTLDQSFTSEEEDTGNFKR